MSATTARNLRARFPQAPAHPGRLRHSAQTGPTLVARHRECRRIPAQPVRIRDIRAGRPCADNYPQAQLADPQEYRARDKRTPARVCSGPDEALYVLPLHLKHDPYLPLKFYTDQSLARGETDPLASMLGYLRTVSMEGRRIGATLLVNPAPGEWT